MISLKLIERGETMTVSEVAKMLGTSPLTLRIGLQQGIFPFGVALKTSENSKNYKYVLYPNKVREFCGELENER